jgi:hypothetical protein
LAKDNQDKKGESHLQQNYVAIAPQAVAFAPQFVCKIKLFLHCQTFFKYISHPQKIKTWQA